MKTKQKNMLKALIWLSFLACIIQVSACRQGDKEETQSRLDDQAVLLPLAPSNLAAMAVSTSEINLTWDDNASNETSYIIERSLSATTGFAEIAKLGPDLGSYTDLSGLSATTIYYYRINARNSAGDSDFSNIANAQTLAAGTNPDPPTNLIATAISNSQINLSWSDNASNESGYVVQRSNSTATGFSNIATLGPNITSYIDSSGLSGSTTYYYRIYARNSIGNSAYSNTASAQTQSTGSVPVAPTSLSATAVSPTEINLSWTDNADNESSYEVERSSSATTGFTIVGSLPVDTTGFTDDSNLAESTTYYYRIFAKNSLGNSAHSNTANAQTMTSGTLPEVPTAPTNLTATVGSSSRVDLTWIDNSDNETGFYVERSSTSSSTDFSPIDDVAAGTTSYENSSLTSNTTYWYRVRAYNPDGHSPYSNIAAATTPLSGAPTLSGPATSEGSITLTWTYGGWSPLLGSTSDRFELQESTSSSNSGFTNILTSTDRVSSESHTISRTVGTYYYRVRAYNISSFTAWSNVVTVRVEFASPTLRVINDLYDQDWVDTSSGETVPWGQYNTIIRVRIGPTDTAVIGCNPSCYERLTDINYVSDPDRMLSITPSYQQTTRYRDFDVNSNGPSYWVYIQAGWWDFNVKTYLWEKHMSWVVNCDGVTAVYKWATIPINNHTAGRFDLRASEILPHGNWYGSEYCN